MHKNCRNYRRCSEIFAAARGSCKYINVLMSIRWTNIRFRVLVAHEITSMIFDVLLARLIVLTSLAAHEPCKNIHHCNLMFLSK